MMAMQYDPNRVLADFLRCRSEALDNPYRKAWNSGVATANRYAIGKQWPTGHDAATHEKWFVSPVIRALINRTVAWLAGGQTRVFVEPLDDASEMLAEPVQDMMVLWGEMNNLGGNFQLGVEDNLVRGNLVFKGDIDITEDAEIGGRIGMIKGDPCQAWFDPVAKNHFHPTLGSEYVGWDGFATRSALVAAYPEHYDTIRKLPGYPIGTNPVAEDVDDPLYPLFKALQSDGTGPMSLYAEPGSADEKTLKQTERLRVTEFYRYDVRMTQWGIGLPGARRPVSSWRKCLIVQPDGSADRKWTKVLMSSQLLYRVPPIVLGSNWFNADTALGLPTVALLGDMQDYLNAMLTMLFTHGARAAKEAGTTLYDTHVITDRHTRDVLASGDMAESIGIDGHKLAGTGRTVKDALAKLDVQFPNFGEYAAIIQIVLDQMQRALGVEDVAMGRGGTPGQRLSGPVVEALTQASSATQSTQAFIASAILTNIGNMILQLHKVHRLGAFTVPRFRNGGGWQMNRSLPLEAAGDVMQMAEQEVPTYEGQYAVPNGLRLFSRNGGNLDIRSMALNPQNLEASLGDESVEGINVVLNDIAAANLRVRILTESDFIAKTRDKQQGIAMMEQYRPGFLPTSFIAKTLLGHHPDIDTDKLIEESSDQELLTKIRSLPEEQRQQAALLLDSLAVNAVQGPAGQGQ